MDLFLHQVKRTGTLSKDTFPGVWCSEDTHSCPWYSNQGKGQPVGSCSPRASSMAALHEGAVEEEQRVISRACTHPAAFHGLPPTMSGERDASPEGD